MGWRAANGSFISSGIGVFLLFFLNGCTLLCVVVAHYFFSVPSFHNVMHDIEAIIC